VHSHERDGRSWKGEWLIIPDATLATGKSLALLKALLMGLQVDKNRMLVNIRATNGFVHAEAVMLRLATALGKQSAHQLIYELSLLTRTEGLDFKQSVIDHQKISTILTRKEIDLLFDLEQSTGMCGNMVDQVISQCLFL
jgi:adenylosuccinate lyase